jgi:alpha-tubulin suppressor-like RCC1 family protein
LSPSQAYVDWYGNGYLYKVNCVNDSNARECDTYSNSSIATYRNVAPYNYNYSQANCANIGDSPLEVETFSLRLDAFFMNTSPTQHMRQWPKNMHGVSANEIKAGYYNACTNHGGAFTCWGHNHLYQLGRGHTSLVGRSQANLSAGSSVRDVWDEYSSSSFNSVSNANGPFLRFPDPIAAPQWSPKNLAFGAYHSCALSQNGRIRCIGQNSFGVLGRNTDSIDLTADTAYRSYNAGIVSNYTLANVSSNINFQDLDVNYYTNCAVVKSNEVFCWGLGTSGQLGTGSLTNVGTNTSPMSNGRIISFPAESGVVKYRFPTNYNYVP